MGLILVHVDGKRGSLGDGASLQANEHQPDPSASSNTVRQRGGLSMTATWAHLGGKAPTSLSDLLHLGRLLCSSSTFAFGRGKGKRSFR